MEEGRRDPAPRRRFRRLGREVRRQRLEISILSIAVFSILPFAAVVRSFSLLGGRRPWPLCYTLHPTSARFASSNSNSYSNSYNSDDSDQDDAESADPDVLECSTEVGSRREKQKSDVKLALLKVAATHDRGFGAGSQARENAVALIRQLERLNEETFASRGIDGPASRSAEGELSSSRSPSPSPMNDMDAFSASSSPLKGCWKLIWTTAWDVLSLEASPFAKTAAIYQVYDPPMITNVIDLMPKIQAAFPPEQFPSSLLRLQVETIGSSPPPPLSYAGDDDIIRNRIGVEFRTVQARPLQLLGTKLDVFPPLRLGLPTLPRLDAGATAAATPLLSAFLPASLLDARNSLFGSSGSSTATTFDGRGYFDVTFVDEDFLVIRQQGGGGIGGLFALIKVDNIDP